MSPEGCSLRLRAPWPCLQSSGLRSGALLLALIVSGGCTLFALDPHKAIAQYSHTIWTQAEGLPQDTIRAISQTPDGYLWLGTNEGLARFDGYEFVTFTADDGALPANSVTKLHMGQDGRLWIGTVHGLAVYRDRHFKIFGPQDGFTPGNVSSVVEDHAGTLWLVSDGHLIRYQNGKFFTYPDARLAPVESARVVYEDQQQRVWVGGVGGVVRLAGSRFVPVLGSGDLRGSIVTDIVLESRGLWLAGTSGIILRRADGSLRRFGQRDGLPKDWIVEMHEDRDGNLWVASHSRLTRLEGGRFIAPPSNAMAGVTGVWSLFEDREGDLWVGMEGALARLRDTRFQMYGSAEGLPADEPIGVHQDRNGVLWVGYHDTGLLALGQGKSRTFTVRDGLASDQILSIREARNGDLLIGTARGLSRMHRGRFQNYLVPDPLGRTGVYDAIEDRSGQLWAATPSGVYRLHRGVWQRMVHSGSTPADYSVVLLEERDGSLWAGTLLSGLWQVRDPKNPHAAPHLFTKADGFGPNRIRSLQQDEDGTLWIGTFGGGLARLRGGVFQRFTAHDGLLSDNIAYVQDDGRGNLWISTTRGISRIPKRQLEDFAAGKIHRLTPENFGTADGLRSTQCAPGFPAGGGGTQTRDGHLWYPTIAGLATIDPGATVPPKTSVATPITHLVEFAVDGHSMDLNRESELKPGTGLVQFRYAGVYLSAPQRVHYSYKLEGLDSNWIDAGSRRLVDYYRLPHGSYRFVVRASLPGGGVSESQFTFEVLPHFYESGWFLWLFGISLMGAVYGAHRLRLHRIHGRFALVFEERARLAREIHDTLAQGFVGISAQLGALAMKLDGDPEVARQHLKLAQKMARHSLTEARRSVMDLRTSELEERDLPTALQILAREWVAGSPISVEIEVGDVNARLPGNLEQNLLRIAQEAVMNAVKHAKAHMIWVGLAIEGRFLHLHIKDDGQGFDISGSYSATGGHFGVLGMRERAERLGGQFSLASQPGSGTQVEVTVPIAP